MSCAAQESVAITHNYVGPAGLPAVLAFARAPAAERLVSGCASADRTALADRLVAALRQHRPEVHSLCWVARDFGSAPLRMHATPLSCLCAHVMRRHGRALGPNEVRKNLPGDCAASAPPKGAPLALGCKDVMANPQKAPRVPDCVEPWVLV